MPVRWPGSKKNLHNACILIDYAMDVFILVLIVLIVNLLNWMFIWQCCLLDSNNLFIRICSITPLFASVYIHIFTLLQSHVFIEMGDRYLNSKKGYIKILIFLMLKSIYLFIIKLNSTIFIKLAFFTVHANIISSANSAINIKMHLTFHENCQEFFVKNYEFKLYFFVIIRYHLEFNVELFMLKKAPIINISSKKSGLKNLQ